MLRPLSFALIAGCNSPSELTLTLFVDDSALVTVETFPVQALVDFGGDQKIHALHICTYEDQDFLQATFEPVLYRGCRSATTVRGVLVPLELDGADCEHGKVVKELDALPPEAEWLGYGEKVVFDSDICGVIQDTSLTIEAY